MTTPTAHAATPSLNGAGVRVGVSWSEHSPSTSVGQQLNGGR